MEFRDVKQWGRGLLAALAVTGISSCGGGSSDNDGDNRVVDTTTAYELVWSDEFNGGTLDSNNWTAETGYGPSNDGWGNDERQLYTGASDNLKVIVDPTDANNGLLSITARCSDGVCGSRNGSITSAKINTKDKFEFKYGKVQARIQVPDGKSTWPAFWMLGAEFPNTIWPQVGELDIMEMHQFFSDNQTTHFTTHWYDDAEAAHKFVSQFKKFDAPLTNSFHVFEMEWTDKQITGKIDDITYYSKTIDPATMDEFYKEFYMILNVAVDGTLGGPPDAIKTTPQEMLVDWVRVYQIPSAERVSLISEDATASSTSQWSYKDLINSVIFGGNSTVSDLTSTAVAPLMGGAALEIDYQTNNAFFSGAAFRFDSSDISDYGKIVFSIDTSKFDNFKDVGIEFVDGRNTGDAIGKKSVLLSSYTPIANTLTAREAGNWNTYEILLSDFSGVNMADITMFGFWNPKDNDDNLAVGKLYIDNIYLEKVEGTGGDNAPTTAAPTPTAAAANVISLYSEHYTSISGVSFPNWGQSTTVTQESIAGNDAVKFTGLGFQGIDFSTNLQDVSEMTTLHLDLWTPNDITADEQFLIKLVDFGADGAPAGDDDTEKELTFTSSSVPALATGRWISFDIPLSDFTGVSKTKLAQLIVSGGGMLTDAYLDNIYFYNTNATSGLASQLTFEDASDQSYSWTSFDGGAANVIDNPQTTGNGSSRVSQLIKGAGETWAGSTLTLDSAIDFSQGEFFSMNFWSASAKPVLLKLEGVKDGADTAAEVTVNHTGGSVWESLSFDFSDQTAALGDVVKLVIIVDNGVVGDGSTAWTFYVDDIAQTQTGGGSTDEFDDGLLTNGDFESGTSSWTGNAANVTDELLGVNGSHANFASVEAAGNPWDVSLQQVVAITQGETYTLTFKAKSDGNRTLSAGIGLNQEPWTGKTEEVNLTTEWQTFTLTLPAADFGGSNSRVIFDMGAATGQVIIDEVSLVKVGAEPTDGNECEAGSFDDGLLTNGNFENGATSWTGNAANVTDETVGCNSSKANFANVETAGNASDVNLSQVVSITEGNTYTLTFKAKSDGSRTMVAGIGLNEAPWTSATETVNLTTDWKTYTLTLTATDFGNANSRVLFDMGAATGQVIIDEVSLVQSGTAGTDECEAGVFDDGLLTNGDFESGVSSWTGNAASVTDELLGCNGSKANFASVDAAGDAHNVNLSQVVSITEGNTYTLTFKAKSDGNRTLVAGIGLNEGDFANTTQTVNLTSGWETYTLPLTASNFGSANSRVLFDMGAATGQVIIDEVSLVLSSEGSSCTAPGSFDDGLLSNGDFQSGTASWSGTEGQPNVQEFDCNKVSYANLEAAAANSWDVNIQQVLTLTQGKTYTLSFKAKSDRSRPLNAGIGINYGLYDKSDLDTVNLTSAWQTFTLTLSAATFGDSNNRVFFEMGASAGEVFIDEVSLVEVATPAPPVTGTVALPVNFDDSSLAYSWSDFDGGVATVIDNPQTTGNSSAKVAQMVKNADKTWGGSSLVLDTAVDFSTGTSFTMNFWSASAKPVLLKFENADGGHVEETANHTGGSNWQTLTFDFASKAAAAAALGEVKKAVVIVDNGTMGDGSAAWTFYIDDIAQSSGTTSGGTVALPVNFDDSSLTYNWSDFDGGVATVIDNPQATGNSSAKVAQMVKNAGQVWGGSSLVLDTAVDFSTGTSFTMNFWSASAKPVLLKFENADGGHVEETANHTGGSNWQTLTFDFASKAAAAAALGEVKKAVVIVDNGTMGDGSAAWTFYIDDIAQSSGTTSGGTVALPVNFDDSSLTYNWSDFDGGVATVIDNPQATGNSSAKVAQMVKNAGQVWGGSSLVLDTAVDFSTGTSFTMNFWSASAKPVLLKFENADGGHVEETANHTGGSNWQTLTFDFASKAAEATALGEVKKAVVIVDNGTMGDGSAAWTFYIDDIAQSSGTTSGGTVALPVNFDDSSLTYNWSDFDGGVATVIDNPQATGNSSAKVAQMVKNAGQVWGGSSLVLDTAVDFSTGTSFTMNFWSASAKPVLLKFENADGGHVEETANHTGGSNWQTLTFDFASKAAAAAALGEVKKAVVIVDNGTMGDGSAAWTFYIDDIAQSSGTTSGGTVALPVNFDDSSLTYNWSDFDGGVATVIDNPQATGNSSAKVAQMVKNAGQVWGGSSLVLDTAVDFSTGTSFTMNFWSASAKPVLLKFENADGGHVEETANHTGGSNWQTLTFDFASQAAEATALGEVKKAVVIVDNGTMGDGSAAWTFYIDDIAQESGGTTPSGGSFTNGDFETGGLAGWAQVTDAGTNATPGTISRVAAPGGRAGSVVRLEAAGSAAGSQDVLLTQVVGAGTINAGDTIDVSFDLYGSLSGAGGVVYVELIYLDGNGDDNGRNFLGAAAPYTPTTTWTTHSGSKSAGVKVDGTMASVAGGVMLQLKASCGPIANGCGVDAYIDNVTFTITP